MNEHANTPPQAPTDLSRESGSTLPEPEVGLTSKHILDALESTIVTIERMIANRSRDELHQAAHDGGWGIVEILSHMQDWEEVTHERVRSMLAEDHPALDDYDDTLWAIEHDYGSQEGDEVLASISALRGELVDRLRELEEVDWQRPAVLSGQGEITLQWLMQKLVKHDAKHLGQAREVFG